MRRVTFPVALAACLAACGPAGALINPEYTPVDLVRQSEVILRLELSPPDAKGALGVQVVEALEGQAPANLALVADLREKLVKDALARAFAGGKKAVPALLFLGDHSAAKGEAAAAAGPAQTVGVLHLRIERAGDVSRWLGVYKGAGGSFAVGTDPLDMKAVWAGSNGQLLRAVRYIRSDYRADMPVTAGVAWGGEARLGTVEGAVGGARAIDPDGSGKPLLFIAAAGGDRLYAPQPGRKLADVTAQRKLTTRSRHFAWGDFDGDGRADLASSDGKTLSVARGRADGTFAAPAVVGGFGLAPIGLCVAPAEGRAALLVSTPAEPLLVTMGQAGKPARVPLPKPAGGYTPLGEAGPCVVADFDGDGRADVLQPAAKGTLLYRPTAGGAYAAGVAVAAGLGVRPSEVAVGDFDADGLLDCLLTCRKSCGILHNLGGGRFRETLDEAGEVVYNTQGLADGSALLDLNNDGRLDMVLTRHNTPLQLYFNRGFACFGYAVDLELKRSDLACARSVDRGQQAAPAADFDGDGAEDLAVVAANGEAWVLFRDAAGGAALGLTVSLPAGAPGPAVVSAADRKRSLGARLLTPGGSVVFGKVGKGPLDVTWRLSGGKPQRRRVLVIKPTRFVLPMDGQ